MADFIAYIDEAGDEGFDKPKELDAAGGQSFWLVIGACIVPAEFDAKLPTWRDEILGRLPGKHRDLHFRNYSHADKVFITQQIAARPLGAAMTFSHKVTIPGSRFEAAFRRKGYLYNYLVRWLLERITAEVAAIGDGNNRLKLVFSRRGGTDYETMRDYLILMRDGLERIAPVRSIVWRVLNVDHIVVENHSKWAGLQFADCMTSAFFNALEPNRYGNYETAYADNLRPCLIRKNGNALNHGIAPVPSFLQCKPDDRQKAYFLSFTEK